MKRIALTLLLVTAACGLAGLLCLFLEWASRHLWGLIALAPVAIAGRCYGLAGALLRNDAEEAPK